MCAGQSHLVEAGQPFAPPDRTRPSSARRQLRTHPLLETVITLKGSDLFVPSFPFDHPALFGLGRACVKTARCSLSSGLLSTATTATAKRGSTAATATTKRGSTAAAAKRRWVATTTAAGTAKGRSCSAATTTTK
jgi:hypothetical protein